MDESVKRRVEVEHFGADIACGFMAASAGREYVQVQGVSMTGLGLLWLAAPEEGVWATQTAFRLLADAFKHYHGGPLTEAELAELRAGIDLGSHEREFNNPEEDNDDDK